MAFRKLLNNYGDPVWVSSRLAYKVEGITHRNTDRTDTVAKTAIFIVGEEKAILVQETPEHVTQLFNEDR